MPTCYRHPDRETGLSCSECGRPICTECMTAAPVGLRCPDHAGTRKVVKPPRVVRRAPHGATDALVTRTLIGINVADLSDHRRAGRGHQRARAAGCSSKSGPLTAPYVAQGDWWRLITAAFLHASILHIGFNMYVLWVIGAPCRAVPRPGALPRSLLRLRSRGVGGRARPHADSRSRVGASGAIFGILGALLIIEWQTTGRLAGNAMTWIVINLVLVVRDREHLDRRAHRRPDRRHPHHARRSPTGVAVTRRTGRSASRASRLVGVAIASVAIAYFHVRGYA